MARNERTRPNEVLLKEASATIRHLAAENMALKEEAAQFRKLAMAQDTVRLLVNKGVITRPEGVLPKLAQLSELPADELETLHKAASLSPAEFAELGKVDDTSNPNGPGASASQRFVANLLG